MISAHTHGPAGTRALGQALATLVQPGDVVLLVGGLGAGKTTFVQGLARGLGYGGDVRSPTFTLCHTYSGRVDLVHVDLWRLDHTSEVLDLGLDEELESGAVVVAEWGEGAMSLLGEEALVIRIEAAVEPASALQPASAPQACSVAGEDEREIAIEAHGSWVERAGALAAMVGEVTV
jgi:tRNA threonylcarbamoyladenosine biosynthesis protein TsaE